MTDSSQRDSGAAKTEGGAVLTDSGGEGSSVVEKPGLAGLSLLALIEEFGDLREHVGQLMGSRRANLVSDWRHRAEAVLAEIHARLGTLEDGSRAGPGRNG